jgi:anti-sigma B factor antagonist
VETSCRRVSGVDTEPAPRPWAEGDRRTLSTGPANTTEGTRDWHVREGQLAEDEVPSYIWSLDIETRQGRTKATVTLAGSLDEHSSASFRDCVDEALGANPTFVVIDARGLTFVDASGLAALVRARRAASEAGVAFRVSDASPALRDVAEEAGFEALLPDQ